MMTAVRTPLALALLAATLLTFGGCSSGQSDAEQIQAAETAQLAPLKDTYSGVIMGFDYADDTTLLVSLDIQNYMGTDDDKVQQLKKDVIEDWRKAWIAQHPKKHAVLRARFIDFVGKKIFEEKTIACVTPSHVEGRTAVVATRRPSTLLGVTKA